MLLVSVMMSRDQTEITIIVRMLLGSVRAGANIFHFNLISLSASIIEWEGGEAGQAVTIYQGLIGSGGAACASAQPRGHHSPHITSRSPDPEPETPLYWSPGTARRLRLVQREERREREGGCR